MFLSADDLIIAGAICFVMGFLPSYAMHLLSKPKRDARGRFKGAKNKIVGTEFHSRVGSVLRE